MKESIVEANSRIDLKLTEDIVRLITEAGAWTSDEPKTWDTRAGKVAMYLNARQEDVLLARLSAIKSFGPRISEAYANSTLTLLRRRQAYNPGKPVLSVKPAAHGEIDMRMISDVASKLFSPLAKPGAGTVLSFQTLEATGGSLPKLRTKLWKQLRTAAADDKDKAQAEPQISLELAPIEPMVYREKARYLGHSLWLTYQLLPGVIVRRI